MKSFVPIQTILRCASILVLTAAVVDGIVLAVHNQKQSTASTAKTLHQTTATKTPSKKTAASTPTVSNNQITNLTTSNASDADKQAAADANTQPVTDACKLLTLHVAQQLLGTGAGATATSDTSSLQTTDTSLSSCAYANGSADVQLVVRKPTSAAGTSENDTVFGSARPADAVNIAGYGQSAYWNPDNNTLNVLGSNNWYIMSRSSNTQKDAEAAADLLKSGF